MFVPPLRTMFQKSSYMNSNDQKTPRSLVFLQENDVVSQRDDEKILWWGSLNKKCPISKDGSHSNPPHDKNFSPSCGVFAYPTTRFSRCLVVFLHTPPQDLFAVLWSFWVPHHKIFSSSCGLFAYPTTRFSRRLVVILGTPPQYFLVVFTYPTKRFCRKTTQTNEIY